MKNNFDVKCVTVIGFSIKSNTLLYVTVFSFAITGTLFPLYIIHRATLALSVQTD